MLPIFLLLSPLLDTLSWSIKNALWYGQNAEILAIIQYVLVEPFNVTGSLEGVVLDSVYLIPSEIYQALLILVWLVPLLVACVLYSYGKKPLILPLLIGTFIVLGLSWGYGSTYQNLPRNTFAPSVNDFSAGTIAYQDWHGTASGVTLDIPTVENYQMEFRVTHRLNAEVSMTLEEPIADHPFFTLYRGFRISSITDEFGNDLDFVRDDDFFKVVSVDDGARTLHVSYSGTGGGHFSNVQGIFLTSAFPYYPWPGKQQYWTEWLINPRRGEVHRIEVKVDAPFDEVLTPQGQNVANLSDFTLISSDDLTLMAGQLEQIGCEDTFKIFGGKRTLEWFEREWLDAESRIEIVDRSHELREMFGLNTEDSHEMYAIVALPTMTRFSNLYDLPVCRGNYVLTTEISGMDKNRASALLALRGIERHEETRDVFAAFLSYLSDPLWYSPENNFLHPDDPLAWSYPYIIFDAVNRDGGDVIFRIVVDFLMQRGDITTEEQLIAYLEGQ